MKISKYPKMTPLKEQYSAGDIACLFGISHRSAARMIDSGDLPGHTVPGGKTRRVLHVSLVEYVRAHPEYKYVLAKLQTESDQ